jgi:Zn-dependent protease with chaperone function
MREKDFIALVERLEIYERAHPAAYRLRVALLAALGYLTLFGVLGVTVLFVAAVIYGRRLNLLIIAILVTLISASAMIIRSLWIGFQEPEGHEFNPEDAPRLFELLKEVRAKTDGPRLHKVLLTSDYNASILQQPWLGVFGSRNYLLIGLPLLRALSPDDVRAVLAHEFGHLSGNHGKFSSWIYRVRQTWTQLLENMQQHRRDFPMFEKFFNWYAPYFEAYSFVLARAQEYEADRCSVTVSGKENSARALINMKLKGRLLSEEFFPELYGRADTQPEPPGESFSEMLQSLHDPVPREKAKLWFADTLTTRHRYHDTHPALAERLASMGFTSVRERADLDSFVIADNGSGADQYFLTRVPAEFIEQQNSAWKESLAERWEERHKFVAVAQEKLVEFEEKAKAAELTVEERWERADFMINKEGAVAAMPLLHEVLNAMPDHVAANYMLGQALLSQGDEHGIQHVEAAMEKDVHIIPAGCEWIVEFLTIRERNEEADRYRDCVSNYYDELEQARREREKISKKDTFAPHGLAEEAVDELRKQLEQYPLLTSAYLVRKVCEHFPQDTSYVLGVRSKRFLGLQLDSRDNKLISELAGNVSYPGYTYIIALEGSYKKLRKIFKRIEGSEIYRAS